MKTTIAFWTAWGTRRPAPSDALSEDASCRTDEQSRRAYSAPRGDLDAIHQHIDFRDGLFENNGQAELFGAVNPGLATAGDFRAIALGRPFDGLGISLFRVN